MAFSPSLLYRTGSGTPWDARSVRLRNEFSVRFRGVPSVWCSAPGRTELGGNHTDHNRGRVLAAAVQVDALAAAKANGTDVVTVYSIGYDRPFTVGLDSLLSLPGEAGNSGALIRGVIARLTERGYAAGGFDAVVHSDVAPGSGLSSSASFEVLVGSLVSWLFHRGSIPAGVLAEAGQYAENHYFGKPCGLMDQLASASGGTSHINFADPESPWSEQVVLDPEQAGYALCVVQTGGSHADLTAEYASIPSEMRAAARCCGLPDCRDLSRELLMAEARRVRAEAGDRAFLRALHFIDENERVLLQVAALKAGEFAEFLRLVNDSGNSSAMLLQNCWVPLRPLEQGVALALALTRDMLRGDGACRVHGGGFAGTIQAYVPSDLLQRYRREMESFYGEGCVLPLAVRPQGAVALDLSGFASA